MAQREDGWPLGLQPLNMRIGLLRNRDLSESLSFGTLITASPASSLFSSSDFDTESTGSFFHDNSITLGSLISTTGILNLSGRRSIRQSQRGEDKKNPKYKTWFSLCTRACFDVASSHDQPSLGHFLEVERRSAAAAVYGANPNRIDQRPNEYPENQTIEELNSLFVNGRIVPPQVGVDGSSPIGWFGSNTRWGPSRGLNHANGHGFPILLSCVCGQPSN